MKKIEKRLCESIVGFMVTSLCALCLGVHLHCLEIGIVGIVSFALAGLCASLIIALPALNDKDKQRTKTDNK